MKLHYQIQGQGEPLVIIHGLFGSADNWRSMAKYFSKHYQVITIDLRNHGRSPHSDNQSLADMAEDLIELCQQRSLTKINLLGHSLGGKVAMKFVERYSSYADKLIVVDISPRQYEGEHTPLMDAMLALNLTQMHSRQQVDEALAMSIEDKAVRQFLLMNLSNENGLLKWRINLRALKANYKEFMSEVLTKIKLETKCLFIYGEQSNYVTSQDKDSIQRIFPNAEFAALPSGHWVHAERPQQFKQVVEEFITR
jgi:pimeloyl-ACP methyl ester carboxylesterase